MNSGIISCREVSKILNYSPGHIKLISKNLDDNDAYALIDQRKGQEEFRFTPEVKSELILQYMEETYGTRYYNGDFSSFFNQI